MNRRIQILVVLLVSLAALCCQARRQARTSFPRRDVIGEMKDLQESLGFERTRNFSKLSGKVAADHRCYYTGRFELPDSYEGLRLTRGTAEGCDIDESEYDVFFYPMEAVAGGKTPVTESLSQASLDRLLVIVPHEDFHDQKAVRKLPATMSETASTLIGFLTAAEFARNKFGAGSEEEQRLSREAELFLRKAEIVNRYHARLRNLYNNVRSGEMSREKALEQKQNIFQELEAECEAIDPSPQSFNRCPSASNNAALAFDHSYTKHYPLMHELFVAQGGNLRKTIETLTSFRKRKKISESEAEQHLMALIEAAR